MIKQNYLSDFVHRSWVKPLPLNSDRGFYSSGPGSDFSTHLPPVPYRGRKVWQSTCKSAQSAGKPGSPGFLSSRHLVFDTNPVGARLAVPGAIEATDPDRIVPHHAGVTRQGIEQARRSRLHLFLSDGLVRAECAGERSGNIWKHTR